MLKRLGILFSLALSLLVTLKGKLHLMIDRCRRSVKRGPWILGITFFTALWILYVPGCALSAATETEQTLTLARARVKDTLKLLLGVLRVLRNRNDFCAHACKMYVQMHCTQPES